MRICVSLYIYTVHSSHFFAYREGGSENQGLGAYILYEQPLMDFDLFEEMLIYILSIGTTYKGAPQNTTYGECDIYVWGNCGLRTKHPKHFVYDMTPLAS